MKPKRKLAIILIVILLIIGITSLSYTFLFTPEVEEIDMQVEIGEYVGVTVETDKIYFGTIYPGGGGSRRIILENDGYFPEKITISASGNISEWISIEENNFILARNETKRVAVNVYPPFGSKYGDYAGILRIVSKNIYF